ncbi:uncharacterized protein LOC141632730 [Silene latifolia]|uniref:uncharacterized protein LOC141632730 n=1 Tax=Silene latifolia TaxID=37657 RepID=UPI003D776307
MIGNGYEWLTGIAPKQNWTTVAWNDWNLPKHSFISWLILQEGINTKSKLFAYGYCTDDSCILCDEYAETIDHLFMDCTFSCKVRGHIEDWIARPFPNINDLMAENRNSMKWKALAMILNTYRYYVWYHRNQARIQLSVVKPALVAERMKKLIQQRIRSFVKLRDGQDETGLRNQLGFDF